MLFQAHRGVSTEFPENTMPAFTAAWEQGYQVIELDPPLLQTGNASPFTMLPLTVLAELTVSQNIIYNDFTVVNNNISDILVL